MGSEDSGISGVFSDVGDGDSEGLEVGLALLLGAGPELGVGSELGVGVAVSTGEGEGVGDGDDGCTTGRDLGGAGRGISATVWSRIPWA